MARTPLFPRGGDFASWALNVTQRIERDYAELKAAFDSLSMSLVADMHSISAVIKADISSVSAAITTAYQTDDDSVSAVIKSDISSVSAVIKSDISSVSAAIKADISSVSAACKIAWEADIQSASTVIKTDLNSVSAAIKTDISSVSSVIQASIDSISNTVSTLAVRLASLSATFSVLNSVAVLGPFAAAQLRGASTVIASISWGTTTVGGIACSMATVSFTQAFATACAAVVTTNGDPSALPITTIISHMQTLNANYFVCLMNHVPQPVRVDWLAWGT